MTAPTPPWTPEEDGLLRSIGAAGESVAAIATLLKRSPHAVRKRAYSLKDQVGPFAARAEGEEEMTMPRPQQWTEAEVHRLRMLVKRKVSADSIAKLLGRYVGSVKTKARELNLILSRRLKVKK